MSTMAVIDDDGTLIGADELTREVRRTIGAARDDRKRYEPTWHSNLAFAAGQYWLKWEPNQRQLVYPSEYLGRELYSTDVITEYRTTALGELGSDDDRPELLLRRDDAPSEDFQRQLNRAVAWGWDNEWRGDQVLEEVRRLTLDLGTAGVRCRFDATVGPLVADNVPHVNGKPLRSPEDAVAALSNGPTPQVEMKPIRQGRICWEPLSAFNILTPPGVPHEDHFPWECVVRPVLLSVVKAEYGQIAADLKEDTDIGSLLGISTDSSTGETQTLGVPAGKPSRLRDHVWLFTYYERPSPNYPDGRTIVFAGNKMKPLRVENRLPYVDAAGKPCSGIAYFHWWRVSGRFWSRGLVEAMKDPQRSVNKRRTQINEIIDRGLPVVFVEKNSPAKERKGLPMEIIEIGPQERAPQPTSGISPGEWMYHDIQEMRGDIEHATGIRGPRLGENPQNVTTYAQLALLNENDQLKRSMILREHKLAIAQLVESSVYDIRTYWGTDRKLTWVDEDDQVDSLSFDATKVPTFFIVKAAKGGSKPRSQGAELKKIEELWAGIVATGAFMAAPHDWVDWLKESLEAGQAVDLPQGGTDKDEDKAEMENHLMLGGQDIPVQYYDPAAVHIPIHREAQIQAELSENLELWVRIEAHVQQHVLVAQATARTMAQIVPPPIEPPGMPPGPPTQGGPGAPDAQGAQGAPPGQ